MEPRIPELVELELAPEPGLGSGADAEPGLCGPSRVRRRWSRPLRDLRLLLEVGLGSGVPAAPSGVTGLSETRRRWSRPPKEPLGVPSLSDLSEDLRRNVRSKDRFLLLGAGVPAAPLALSTPLMAFVLWRVCMDGNSSTWGTSISSQRGQVFCFSECWCFLCFSWSNTFPSWCSMDATPPPSSQAHDSRTGGFPR